MRSARSIFMLLLSLVALCGCGRRAPAPPAAYKPPPGFPVARVGQMIDHVLPLVEQTAGAKYVRKPRWRMVDREEIARVLGGEMTPVVRKCYPGLRSQDADLAAKGIGSLVSAFLLGKYGTREHVLYIVPANFTWICDQMRVPRAQQWDMFRLVVAHELVHALQDQHRSLFAMQRACKSMDQVQATGGVIEGQASLVTEQIARKLGQQKIEARLTESMVGSSEDAEGASPDMRAVMEALGCAYRQGRHFMNWHYKRGGTGKLWLILRNPPHASAVIYHPERYGTPQPGRDYARVLAGIEKRFPGRLRCFENAAVGEMEFRSEFGGCDAEASGSFAGELVSAQRISAAKGGRRISITLMEFSSQHKARQFEPFAVESVWYDEGSGCDYDVGFERLSIKAPHLWGFDHLYQKRRGRVPARGWSFYVTSSGCFVVMCRADGVSLSAKQVSGAVSEIFGRIDRQCGPLPVDQQDSPPRQWKGNRP